MITETINASRRLMIIMKISEVVILSTAQVTSTTPHVTSSATRPVSDVTRAISRPTAF